jgi:hypothetical protein
MSVQPLLDAAGRRRSPATTPGYRAGIAPRNKGQRYPPTHRPSTRSSRSCAKLATIGTATASTR